MVKNIPLNDWQILRRRYGSTRSYKNRIALQKSKLEEFSNWLQNKNTLEFLTIWEQINNPNFNLVELHQIKNQVGLNRFVMSAKKWIESTNAIGLIAKAGRYGGTYAHKDIAFEFGSWLSPEFKLYLIKEFQRLKEQESQQN